MNRIQLNETIQFGKYKGTKPCNVINWPQEKFTEFAMYIAWAHKKSNIVIDEAILSALAEKQREYNFEARSIQQDSDDSADMEPNIWGNDCLPGQMSSWF